MRKSVRFRQIDLVERRESYIRQALVMQRLAGGCIIIGGDPLDRDIYRNPRSIRIL